MKGKIGNPLDEQETIINIAPNAINKRASIYTTMPNMLAKMWKMQEQYPDDVLIVHDDKYGTEFSVPNDWIKIKPKRKLSDEQREAAVARLAEYRHKE